MWVHTSITVEQESVGLAVRCLEPDALERAGATMAWFSYLALIADSSASEDEWQTFMQWVFDHVEFTVAGRDPDDLSGVWWREASWRAVGEFLRVNKLNATVCRHIDALGRAGVAHAAGPQ